MTQENVGFNVRANTRDAERGLGATAGAAALLGRNVQGTILPLLGAGFAGGFLVQQLGRMTLGMGLFDNVIARVQDTLFQFTSDALAPLAEQADRTLDALDRLVNRPGGGGGQLTLGQRYAEIDRHGPGRLLLNVIEDFANARAGGTRAEYRINFNAFGEGGPITFERTPARPPGAPPPGLPRPVEGIGRRPGLPGPADGIGQRPPAGQPRPVNPGTTNIYQGPVYGVEDFDRRSARGAVDSLHLPNGIADADGTIP